MQSGTLVDLWRWPVKSMAGERVRALGLGPHGAGGDRVHAVFGEHKGRRQPVTAREAPRLLAWSAAYPSDPGDALDPADPPLAVVTEPGGRHRRRWDDPGLPGALEDDLGRTVELRRDTAGIPDLPDSVLVTVEASRLALEQELGEPIDLRRFRTNLHLELDAAPWAEHGWEGAELLVGPEVRLQLLHPCERCAIPTRHPETQAKWPGLLRHLDAEHGRHFGINARVVRGGSVSVADQVRVQAAGASASGAIGR